MSCTKRPFQFDLSLAVMMYETPDSLKMHNADEVMALMSLNQP